MLKIRFGAFLSSTTQSGEFSLRFMKISSCEVEVYKKICDAWFSHLVIAPRGLEGIGMCIPGSESPPLRGELLFHDSSCRSHFIFDECRREGSPFLDVDIHPQSGCVLAVFTHIIVGGEEKKHTICRCSSVRRKRKKRESESAKKKLL